MTPLLTVVASSFVVVTASSVSLAACRSSSASEVSFRVVVSTSLLALLEPFRCGLHTTSSRSTILGLLVPLTHWMRHHRLVVLSQTPILSSHRFNRLLQALKIAFRHSFRFNDCNLSRSYTSRSGSCLPFGRFGIVVFNLLTDPNSVTECSRTSFSHTSSKRMFDRLKKRVFSQVVQGTFRELRIRQTNLSADVGLELLQ
jgi:hypothetical protein